MTELQLNDKVMAIDTIRRHGVLVMKKDSIGTLLSVVVEKEWEKKSHRIGNGNYVDVSYALVELSNFSKVRVRLEKLKPYVKVVKVKIEDLPSNELLARYLMLSRSEQHGSTLTKAYQKLLIDIERCENEILKRMGGEK